MEFRGLLRGREGGGGFGPAWLDVYSKGGIWTAPRLSPSKKAPGIRFSVRCPFFLSPSLPPPPSLKHRSVVSDFKERYFWWRRSWRVSGRQQNREAGLRGVEGGNLGGGSMPHCKYCLTQPLHGSDSLARFGRFLIFLYIYYIKRE